jgi:hypothetical protein
VRWERLAENYLAFLHLACVRILLRFMRWLLVNARSWKSSQRSC